MAYLKNYKTEHTPTSFWIGTAVLDTNLKNLMMVPSIKKKLESAFLQKDVCFNVKTKNSDYSAYSVHDYKTLEQILLNPKSVMFETLFDHLMRLLFVTGYLSFNDDRALTCLTFPNGEIQTHVEGIFAAYYADSFGPDYTAVADRFDEFLFDDQNRSIALERAVKNFITKNKICFVGHMRSSLRNKFAFQVTSDTHPAREGVKLVVEGNEAYFATLLRLATLRIRTHFRHVAFEKIIEGAGHIDIFAHNGIKQAVVEVKYTGGTRRSIISTLNQARKYRNTSFSYPCKFIAIIGDNSGNINSNFGILVQYKIRKKRGPHSTHFRKKHVLPFSPVFSSFVI